MCKLSIACCLFISDLQKKTEQFNTCWYRKMKYQFHKSGTEQTLSPASATGSPQICAGQRLNDERFSMQYVPENKVARFYTLLFTCLVFQKSILLCMVLQNISRAELHQITLEISPTWIVQVLKSKYDLHMFVFTYIQTSALNQQINPLPALHHYLSEKINPPIFYVDSCSNEK